VLIAETIPYQMMTTLDVSDQLVEMTNKFWRVDFVLHAQWEHKLVEIELAVLKLFVEVDKF
jgi:hypothetical protein